MPRVEFGPITDDLWERLQPWESRLEDRIARSEAELIEIRRHLHAHPEPSGLEIETSRFVHDRLTRLGLKPWIGRDGIGVVADLVVGNPPPGAPLIAIRADLDALRMPDEKTVEYASRNPGVAHACGHDAHTAAVLGTALSGAGLQGETGGFGARLRLLFQPAEETSEGAQCLVDQGAMEGVDAVLGLHVDPERACGRVGIRYGVLTANCEEVELIVEGHGGHAARPHHSHDPIAAAAHLVNTLYEFLPRTIDSRNPSVFTIGKITGGYAHNVISERVELLGTLRSSDVETMQRLRGRLEDICRGVEQASGTSIDLRFMRPLMSVVNDPRPTAALEWASRRVLGPERIELIDRPSMGGEDFSAYLDHAPGAMLRLGCARSDDARPPFLHSSLFDIDERAIALGTRILLRAALLLSVAAVPVAE